MVKKIFLAMMAFVMLFATSCQNEMDQAVATGNTSTVTFEVVVPELATRAYSDGKAEKVLYYAVYDAHYNEGDIEARYLNALTPAEGNNPVFAAGEMKKNVQLELVTGNPYKIVFWAAVEGAPYTFVPAEATVTVNYDDVVCNNENLDAFFGNTEFTVNGNATVNVELRRPFAQLNIGTNDYEVAAKSEIVPTVSTVTVKEVYSKFHLFTGNVDENSTRSVTFKYGNINKDENFPVEGYKYIAMNYLLVGNDKHVTDISFTCKEDENSTREFSRTVGSVPMQRNYRTNIYGKILTSSLDLDVEIKPGYGDGDNNLYNVVVDGVSYTNFAEAVAKAIELNMPVEFIQNVTIDADETILVPAGKTLTLNLNGYTLSGVSDQTGSNREMFLVKGTLNVNGANTLTRAAAEGNGVISIKHEGDNMGWGAMTTIFDVTDGGVLNIKNVNATNFGGSDMGFVAHLNNWGEVTLNVENSTMESNYVAVRVFNSGNDMNNVTIKNSTLKGGNYAFWVHNYTVDDFGTEAKAEAQKELLNLDIFNGTNKFEGKNDTPIRYGMTNSKYVDENGEYLVTNATDLINTINSVEDGQVIKLTGDVTFDENNRTPSGGNWYEGVYYQGDKSFTIDLNGKTIAQNGAVNDYMFFLKNEGTKANTITLKNGTIDAGTAAYCALATSSSNAQKKITINTENITFVNNNSNGAVLKIRGGAELNVNAGTIIEGKNSYVGIEAVGNNTVVNIYDGAKIYQNGTSSYVGAIVGASYNATMNIYGGYGKSAKCGIIVMSTGATINVSGGEWIANNDGTVAVDNNAVLVSQNNRYESGWACKSVLNVTGGTFKGGYNCYGMGPGVEADDAQINIKGGNFNADPTNYVVAGYEVTGNYTVAKSEALAELEAAIDNGGNVTLNGDITLAESLNIKDGKVVTIDLNGKTITAPSFSAFEVKNGAQLTLKNGKVVAYESTVRAIGGKVVIESGEYTSTGTAVGSPATYRYSLDCRENGELVINGGTFKSNNGMINVSSTVTINGGKFENIVEKTMTRHFAYVSAQLTINDGEFYGKANGSAGGCFFCGAAAGGDIQINGGKFTSLWTSGSVNRIFEVYYGGTINVTGGMFNTNGGIASFVEENTDEATKAAYPYIAK